jgi:hypothetical protein
MERKSTAREALGPCQMAQKPTWLTDNDSIAWLYFSKMSTVKLLYSLMEVVTSFKGSCRCAECFELSTVAHACNPSDLGNT